MILHGNQRGGGKDLAVHLMKPENERVDVHDLRGFVSDSLYGAFQESYAISKGTRCKQHLFSLSINPPHDADIETQDFVTAIDQVEARLGLEGQPRAIVFHEKRGRDGELRRHAHAVWCRIEPDAMKAVQLSFTHKKLREVSRDLHIQHDLTMPPGLINAKDRDPRNFTLEQWQQCKRAKKDVNQVKSIFKDCWAVSDSRASFTHALEEHGYILAKGNRGHVAIDYKGEKYAISRYVDIKAKQVQAKLGEADGLPSLEDAQQRAAKQVADRLNELRQEQHKAARAKREAAIEQRKRMEAAQARQAAKLREAQAKRHHEEQQLRESRIRRGVLGLLDRLTGKRKQAEVLNRAESLSMQKRDRNEVLDLKARQERAFRKQQEKTKAARKPHIDAAQDLESDIRQLSTPPEPDKGREVYIAEQKARAKRPRRARSRDGPEPSR